MTPRPSRLDVQRRPLGELRVKPHTDLETCKAALTRFGRCTWPGCESLRAERQIAGRNEEFRDIPLCSGHMFEVWKLCRDQANRANNRETTVTTEVSGELRTVERPVSTIGWVYYLRIGDHIKIGYASNLLSRLRSYGPTAEFIYAHRGTKTDEKVAHSLLHVRLASGREWFEQHDEVFAFIEQQKARFGPQADPRIKPTHDALGAPLKQQRPTIVRG